MNTWFRRYEQGTDGDGTDTGAAPVTDGDGNEVIDAGDTPADEPAKKPLTEQELTSGMAEAIKKGLETPEDKAAADAKAKADAEADAKAKAAEAGKTLQQVAAEKKAAEEKAAASPKKPKSADELAITDAEKKTWHAKTQARFQELHGEFKRLGGELEQTKLLNSQLQASRDAIVSVLEETHTTDEQLSQMLEFNRMVQTGEYEGALKIVETQRAALYKALGKEGPGVDLLSEHPDLKAEVEEERLTRERALEIARGRMRDAAAQRQAAGQRTAQDQQTEKKKQSEEALSSIEKWTLELKRSDVDYKAKEDKILGKVQQVVKEYPPSQWLSTLKMLYEGIVIEKAAPPPSKDNPLRPRGERPGAPAPKDMKDAIDQGLGYSKPA